MHRFRSYHPRGEVNHTFSPPKFRTEFRVPVEFGRIIEIRARPFVQFCPRESRRRDIPLVRLTGRGRRRGVFRTFTYKRDRIKMRKLRRKIDARQSCLRNGDGGQGTTLRAQFAAGYKRLLACEIEKRAFAKRSSLPAVSNMCSTRSRVCRRETLNFFFNARAPRNRYRTYVYS